MYGGWGWGERPRERVGPLFLRRGSHYLRQVVTLSSGRHQSLKPHLLLFLTCTGQAR